VTGDVWEHPDTQQWIAQVRSDLVPKLRASALSVTIVPEDPDTSDVKLAVELGMSLLLGKPLVLVVPAGTRIPDGLVRAADEIIELLPGPISSPKNSLAVREALSRLLGRDLS
jgi:hypothetical protein